MVRFLRAAEASQALRKLASPSKAKLLSGFFKTGPGQYGEGDVFVGVTMPQIRSLLPACEGLPIAETQKLVRSKIHEERMLGLLIWVRQYQKAKAHEALQERIFRTYMANKRFINNWDLVDVTCPHVLGAHLLTRSRGVLYRLAKSKSLWDRRLSILGTFMFIYKGDSKDALALARQHLKDKEDLMHKAVGWMLREVGKRVAIEDLRGFLKRHAGQMPRTMLRYAIEKMPPGERQRWMSAK